MTLFNDVFGDDAFGFANLTAAINQLPYVESRLGALGYFGGFTEGVETDSLIIDETEGQLQILQSRPRGAPPQKALKEKKAKARAVAIPHFQFEDRVMASSLMGKRKPGQNILESVASKVNDRFTWMLSGVVAPTLEIHRLNALRGILLDADGSILENFFDLFDVAQQTVDFDFSVATTNIREVCVGAARLAEDTLAGIPFSGLRGFASRGFFDKLVDHPTVRDTFIYQQGQVLRGDLRKGFEFGGIIWEEYRGMAGLSGDMGRIAADEALIVPEGVMGMFRTYHSPAGFLETVNELGQPLYAKVAPDWKYNEHVDQLIETNPLHINVRPSAVLRATAT